MNEKMITYKGTDKDMKCHGGFQYELGKSTRMMGPSDAAGADSTPARLRWMYSDILHRIKADISSVNLAGP